MAGKFKVLVVDDSALIRRLVRTALEDNNLQVAGVAATGAIALDMVEQCSPDAITLDLEMPVMDGIETLRRLRESGRKLPVVVFSSLTEKGAQITLDALAAGADDYVTKPSSMHDGEEAIRHIGAELAPKVVALCQARERLRSIIQPAPRVRLMSSDKHEPPEILAIGSSTGGPNALADVFSRLPKNFPLPVVVAQHMPPTFTRFLADRLTTISPLRVEEGRDGALLQPGVAYVAPGDYHMTLRREGAMTRVALNQHPPENSCRPSVDVLFRSVAEHYGSSTYAVVLTGMGQDGLRGCEHIQGAGGQIIVQDEATSVVWGMPGFVWRAGLASKALPIIEIADEIARAASTSVKAKKL